MPMPQPTHYAIMSAGVQSSFLGSMPACKFLSEFFPQPDSPEVLLGFKKDMFKEMLEKNEKDMYESFVRTLSPYLMARR
jgi:hypothetical protein